ncbi:hypothetical protein [Nakamurella sp. PAMC28650]|uniref:hypothetical protein n=1 Tax=Nakamurella sp. PAMC28650 TaxID=2762325 RepID=UPI00164E8A26|nr:hypothetical protein [Nakamurella sp. PAMC28650]QNK82612.1 hypothetical protein H7F38_07860 [Nakamurella sp. PAMC28650]
MNPNAALDALEDHVLELLNGEPERDDAIVCLERIATEATAIASWLKFGGFMPREWTSTAQRADL